MTDCIFCQIVEAKISADIVFEDNLILVFKDINPRAKVHLLIIPKIHIESLSELTEEHHDLMAHMMLQLSKIAREQGLNDGFRTIINTGPGGGQEVGHLHLHLLGGPELPGFN